MTLFAVCLIIISAGIHVSWNLLWKRSSPTAAFFLVAVLSVSILLSPLFLIYRHAFAYFPPVLWFLLVFTGIAEAGYFASLAGAYRKGALSLAYPLARALPVIFVAFISLALGRRDQFTLLGMIGMLLVASGCLIIPLESIRHFHLDYYLNGCTLFAVCAALGTTAYTLIDNQALLIMRNSDEMNLSGLQIPFLYSLLHSVMTAIGLAVFVLVNKTERRVLKNILATNPNMSISAGILSAVAYFFVLVAMANVRDVSYVAAFRQLSVPIGAVLGIKVQREPVFPVRMVGVAVAFIGLIFVAVG